MTRALVSVIITTRNEESNIGRCLMSVMKQAYPSELIEIIVVDNASTDRTKEIVASFPARIFDLGPERSTQRNFGVRQAKGEYIIYLDADMALSEQLIAECVRTCGNSDIVALYLPEKIVGNGFWVKVRNFERSFYDGTSIDCVRFIRRDCYLEIGGFDESLTGPEDWDFNRRIKEKYWVGLITNPIFHDEGMFSLKRYLKKKMYYAKSFDSYIRKWGRKDPEIRRQLGAWYRFVGVFIENGKWKELIRHPILVAGMYFLRINVGIAYLILRYG